MLKCIGYIACFRHRVMSYEGGKLPGNGMIWLENVECVGNETSLANCFHNDWGVHDCIGSQDVFIECIPPPPLPYGR